MTEVERIQKELQRSFEADAWHGPAVMELLPKVNARQAAARPIANAHTIWEITLHMAAWKDYVRLAIQGKSPKVEDDVNWPEITTTTPAAWRAAIERLTEAHAQLAKSLAHLDDDALERPVPGGKRTAYVLLHGIIQHDLYHAGQIALLIKP